MIKRLWLRFWNAARAPKRGTVIYIDADGLPRMWRAGEVASESMVVGSDGEDGADGAPGTKVTLGAVAPVADGTTTGDLFLVLADPDAGLYLWDGEAWVLQGTLAFTEPV